MIKKITAIIGLVILFSSLPKFVTASHVSGGEITYTSLGGNQYKVVLVNYWDCSAFDPGTSLSVTANNTCGLASVSFTVALDSALEISQICPSSLNQTSCTAGGTLPGNKKNVYSAIVTLPGVCSLWTFEHTSCCRNTSINVTTQPSYTFYATLNNVIAPTNNSPYFTSQPLPYMCVNQPVCYSPGVVELDGNTLSYSLVDAMDGNSTTPVAYAGGYSGSAPMPGITIDALTGLISFTPTAIGNFVVSFMVTEKDINGIVIGTVIRDIQMVVVNCTNQVIPCNSGGIFNLVGIGATPTGPNSLTICENIPFSFQMSFTDPDAANILSYTTNISQVLVGSTITSSGTNPIQITVGWTAPPGSSGLNTTFALTISDNACPVTGQQTVNYLIDVLSATNAGPDQIKCGTQGVTLNAVGPGTVFDWSVISGPPLVVGTNFSCTPCQNPIASPTSTTTYLLTCNGGNGCLLTDTVIVNVVPNFTYNITQSATASCLLQPIQLGIINLSPAGAGYTYQWVPATYLSNASIANPVASITSPGTYTYTVTITNPSGCVKKDSLTISVIPAVTPSITAFADTTFCSGQTATLALSFGNGVPATCGLSATGGCASSVPITLGTGTLSTNQYPTPFTGFWDNGRIQILYTSAELNALGFVGGKITSLAFDVSQKNSSAPYNGFKIKMGCTSLSSLPNTSFQNVSTVVYGPVATNTAVGWNVFNFATPYEWDGISNLIVEMCYSNTTYTSTDVLNKTTTAFASVVNDYEDPTAGCTLATPDAFISQFERPNTRFTTCAVAANPSSYSYQWAPASGNIANAAIQNTTAQPTATTTFTVTVTDIAGGCSTTDSVQVNVVNISTLTVTPAGPYCVNGPLDTLQVSVPVGSGTWSGPGITDTNLGVFNPALAGSGPTHEIIFTINGNCGTAADTINIIVTPQPNATITQAPQQCSTGAAITLNAATTGGTWTGTGITNATTGSFDPATAGVGNHIITYTITTPCTAVDTMTIVVVSQLNSTITHVGPFCTSFPAVTLTAVSPGGTWSGVGITDAATGVFDPAVAGGGSHTITYTLPGLCGSIDTDVIDVIANPVISYTTDTTQGCEPTTISFISTVSPSGGTFAWTFGDGNSSTQPNASNTYIAAGSYDVSFTYTITPGCITAITNTNSIIIHSQPVAYFIATPQPTSITNPEVHFIDYSTGQINTWNWAFGLLGSTGSSTLSNPSFVFPDTGTYDVQLIVSNIYGCTDTTDGKVVIDPIVTFYSPNAFTPDGNGLNDLFMVQADGVDYKNFEILIFDRWGERVYKSSDIFEGWNGKINNSGPMLKQDAYVWKVYFKDFKGNKHYYIGHVTLVR